MIRPLRDMLLLRPIGEPPGKVGLIHIPDGDRLSQATGLRAEVVEAGPKVELATKGKTVYVKAYGSHAASDMEVEHGGEKMFLLRERDIVGVFTD